jgi:hypothetical protein
VTAFSGFPLNACGVPKLIIGEVSCGFGDSE